MKSPELSIVQQPTPSGDSTASVEKRIEELTIDGRLPDDDGPKDPSGGGGAARPVPLPPEDSAEEQWVKSLAAFKMAAEDLSRAARHVQLIRYPLESLARDITTMTREIGGTHTELSLLRQNLVPPISVEPTTKEPMRVKHVGTLVASIKPPGLSRRVKSVLWHVTRVIIGALAVWGAMHALGSYWPDRGSMHALWSYWPDTGSIATLLR